jgi:hypothetical protein
VAAEEEALGRSGEDAAAEQPVDPLEHVAVTAEPTNRPQPRLVRRVPPHMHGIGTRLSVVRGAAS